MIIILLCVKYLIIIYLEAGSMTCLGLYPAQPLYSTVDIIDTQEFCINNEQKSKIVSVGSTLFFY